MSFLTVQNTLEKRVSNPYELVLLATKRAEEIINGAQPAVARNKDKSEVVALREIDEGKVSVEALREEVIRAMQEYRHRDDDLSGND